MSPARPSVLLPLLWSRFRRHRHPHQHHAKKNRIFIPKFTPFSLLIQFYYLLYPISIKKVFFLWPFLCSYYKFVCVHIALMSRGKVRSAPKICVCAVKNTLQYVHPPVSTYTHTHIYTYIPRSPDESETIWFYLSFFCNCFYWCSASVFVLCVVLGVCQVRSPEYDAIAFRLFLQIRYFMSKICHGIGYVRHNVQLR